MDFMEKLHRNKRKVLPILRVNHKFCESHIFVAKMFIELIIDSIHSIATETIAIAEMNEVTGKH